jgi:glutaryl-CoA dehydrogenase
MAGKGAPLVTFTPLESDFFAISRTLPDHEKAFLANLRTYLEQEVKPGLTQHWEDATFPREIVAGLSKAGVIGMSYAETWPFPNSALFRGWVALELGRVDASVATYVGVQNGLAIGSIGECGSHEQRAHWLPRLARGEIVGSFGLTEPLSGSDSARGLRTTAERRGDTWVLNGEKRWIGNSTFGDITVIWAKDVGDGQVKGFIVANDAPGFSVEKIEGKISLRIVQNGHITLKDVEVPEENRLVNAHSFADTARVLRNTRTEVAWEAVGVSIGAYEAALAYAKERQQFGKPIASHQLVQDLLVKSLSNITASLALVKEAAIMFDDGIQNDEHAAMAKAFATSKARETVAWCREILGGNGIVLDYDVARFFADAEALYSYEGTREMNTLIIGRSITGHAAFV